LGQISKLAAQVQTLIDQSDHLSNLILELKLQESRYGITLPKNRATLIRIEAERTEIEAKIASQIHTMGKIKYD